MDFRPQHNDGQQRDQHQNGTDQAQGLGTNGIQIQLRFIDLHRSFRAEHMGWLFFAARTLGENFGTTVFRPVEGQTTTLNQHPAANNVVDHQQQEPDCYRGFKTRQ